MVNTLLYTKNMVYIYTVYKKYGLYILYTKYDTTVYKI